MVVEFSTLSYHLRSPGDMSPEELDEVVDFLMERIETQEKTELFHLENFHKTLERYPSINSMAPAHCLFCSLFAISLHLNIVCSINFVHCLILLSFYLQNFRTMLSQ